jgi:hypothetical protein
MNNPWKWIAIGLGIALAALAIFTIFVVNGVMEFSLSLF